MQGSHFSCFCIVCEATSPQTTASPQSLKVLHRIFTAMFVLRAAIVPSGETTQNKTRDISTTEHTTQIYGRQQFTNVPSFSSYKSVLKVCKQDTRPALTRLKLFASSSASSKPSRSCLPIRF